jgi:hypothetical protein
MLKSIYMETRRLINAVPMIKKSKRKRRLDQRRRIEPANLLKCPDEKAIFSKIACLLRSTFILPGAPSCSLSFYKAQVYQFKTNAKPIKQPL